MSIQFTKHQRTTHPARFSVLIPSWNNLSYLQQCIDSLRQHTQLPLQLIVCINEGIDGTLEWVREQSDLDYIHAVENIGICYGLNIGRSLARTEYILYLNDDMYVLPDWDLNLNRALERLTTPAFLLSATMIEPTDTGNPCVVVKDFGRDLETFKVTKLLQVVKQLQREDWSGSTWPPMLVHRDYWDLVGGLSTEFHPGMYSDPDFSKKLYDAGVRIFQGVGDSLVYHFGTKSTRRIKKNRGRSLFLLKWGITARHFFQQYLRMGKPVLESINPPAPTIWQSLLHKGKSIREVWRR